MNMTKALPFCKVIPDEGMPSHGNPFIKGNLYILFCVQFPNDGELPPHIIKLLCKALLDPDMEIKYDPHHVEEVHMNHVDLRHFGKGGVEHASGGVYDSDNKDKGGQLVQCQQS